MVRTKRPREHVEAEHIKVIETLDAVQREWRRPPVLPRLDLSAAAAAAGSVAGSVAAAMAQTWAGSMAIWCKCRCLDRWIDSVK